MISAMELKAESEAYLKKCGYPINASLPQIEDFAELRVASPVDVRRRLLVLSCACARAYGAQYDLVVPWIDKHGLRDAFSAKEAELIDARKPSEALKATFRLQPEAIWEFAWVLNEISSIDHFKPCSEQLVDMFPKPGKDPVAFLESSVDMRDHESLFREADRLYRIHWAVRDAALRGRKSPTGLGEYATLFRLKAINWTVRSQLSWDETDVST